MKKDEKDREKEREKEAAAVANTLKNPPKDRMIRPEDTVTRW